MNSQQASSGEHPKIIGPPTPEHKLQTILRGRRQNGSGHRVRGGRVSPGMHAAEAVVSTLVTPQPSPSRLAPTPGPLHDPRPHPAGRSHKPEAFLDTPRASRRLRPLHHGREDISGRGQVGVRCAENVGGKGRRTWGTCLRSGTESE